ncbi:MAG: NAD-dependent epimerase/dehydratase family protein [Clostridiales bacterium]|nr:NAD-dependent epimerase/dehydratase family protein [Clostridiales bacterium]
MKKTFLITGGAGYIGTNLIYYLLKNDFNAIVVDNLSNSNLLAINNLEKYFKTKIKFFNCDIRNEQFLTEILQENKINAVIHLAAKKYIAESFIKEQEYLKNNIDGTQSLLNSMNKSNVKEIYFASSISVYGNPVYLPLDINHPLNALSPYAKSKVECEKIITKWQKNTPDSTAILFRFTNPVGARNNVMLGDNPTCEYSTLFPQLVKKIEVGEQISINGNTHPTKDGSCVRDFIDIKDLTEVVFKFCTQKNQGLKTIIVGNGKITYSVLDVIKSLEKIYNKNLDYKINPARPNEVPLIEVDNSFIVKNIDYSPKCNLLDMLQSQVEFTKSLNKKP